MRVVLMIEGQEGVTWEQWHALARASEDHGLEGLFRSDHYVSVHAGEKHTSLDAWTVLAALAAVTDRIRLGTLVSPVTFRHPSLLANAAATVDLISGGRVELGMGAGWHGREHDAFGFPFPATGERMDLLEEQLEIVHRLWSDDVVSFEGRHYRLDRARSFPSPVQTPHPPLLLGGRAGPRSATLAARWADEYNTVFASAEECAERRARVAGAWRAAGRDPDALVFSLMTGCVVGRDRGDVEERMAAVQRAEGDEPDPARFRAAHPAWLAGTVEEVAEGLRELEGAGVGRVMLQHLAHDDLEMVALLGREVAPAVG